jgi:hypothetical protein
LSLAHFSSVYGVFDRIKTGSFYLIPTRVWEILIGVFIALHLKNIQESISCKFNQGLSLLGFSMIIYSIIFFDGHTPFPSLYTLLPTIGTALVIISAKPNTIIYKILNKKWLVFLGLISYSTYLWHQPIFAFTRHKLGNEVSELYFVVLSLLSILLGYVSWKWVEKPFREKNRISRKEIFIFSISGMFLFIILGSVTSLSNGFLSKYSKIEQGIYQEFMNAGIYNTKNMELVKLVDFDSKNEKKKLLVIGDSYAEDLINAIEESNLKSFYQLSSYRIPGICGVLYLNTDIIKGFQPNSCLNRPNFFNEPKIQKLLMEADAVWLQSAWQDWQLEFMKESLLEMKKLNKNIVLFGSKAFEIKSSTHYKNKFGERGLTKSFPISEREKFLTTELNIIAKSVDIQYIDSMSIICRSEETCKHSFNGEGIISIDGGHLTRYGAEHFGTMLEKTLLHSDH